MTTTNAAATPAITFPCTPTQEMKRRVRTFMCWTQQRMEDPMEYQFFVKDLGWDSQKWMRLKTRQDIVDECRHGNLSPEWDYNSLEQEGIVKIPVYNNRSKYFDLMGHIVMTYEKLTQIMQVIASFEYSEELILKKIIRDYYISL